MTDFVITSRPDSVKPALAINRRLIGRLAVDSLCLAATPTFAVMALLTAFGGGEPDVLCAAMTHASPLDGMTLMYLLMSVFHARPWLKVLNGR